MLVFEYRQNVPAASLMQPPKNRDNFAVAMIPAFLPGLIPPDPSATQADLSPPEAWSRSWIRRQISSAEYGFWRS